MLFFNKNRFPKRNEFHKSNFSENKARKVAQELKSLNYFEYVDKSNIPMFEEQLAFSLYEQGIIDTFCMIEGRRCFDFRSISADAEALANREGQKSTLKLIHRFITKRVSEIVEWNFRLNKLGFIESISFNDSVFLITESDRINSQPEFEKLQINICVFVNEILRFYNSFDRIYPTKAGGFYFLSDNLFDYCSLLPSNEYHKPIKVDQITKS